MIPFLKRSGIAPHSTKRLVELGEEYLMYNGGRPGAMTNKIKLIAYINKEFIGTFNSELSGVVNK